MHNTSRIIDNIDELGSAIDRIGFLPLFRSPIRGCSVYELTPSNLWFSDTEDGPWEWKGPLIREGNVAYGKIYGRKAGYVSREWLPHFANYRRSHSYAPNDDMAALDDIVLQTISIEGGVTIKDLRRLMGLDPGRNKRRPDELIDDLAIEQKISLDPVLTRLMMGMRVVISDFVYNIDRKGNPYGWGIAKYTVPEALYGDISIDCSPSESLEAMVEHMGKVAPWATDRQIRSLLG